MKELSDMFKYYGAADPPVREYVKVCVNLQTDVR